MKSKTLRKAAEKIRNLRFKISEVLLLNEMLLKCAREKVQLEMDSMLCKFPYYPQDLEIERLDRVVHRMKTMDDEKCAIVELTEKQKNNKHQIRALTDLVGKTEFTQTVLNQLLTVVYEVNSSLQSIQEN